MDRASPTLLPHNVHSVTLPTGVCCNVSEGWYNSTRNHVPSHPTGRNLEFLRNIYATADLRISPRPKLGKLEVLKEFARGLGIDPEKILVQEAFAEPQTAYLDPTEQAARQFQQLSTEMLRRFIEQNKSAPQTLESAKIQR